MSDTVATAIILVACLLGAAGVIVAAGYVGRRYGQSNPLYWGAVAAAIAGVALLVWAVVARFDADVSEASTHVGTHGYAGVASNAGPVVGVPGNGACDPACLLAWVGRHGGAAN